MYTFALILWEIGTANIPFGEMSPLCAGLKVYIQDGVIVNGCGL